MKVTSINARVDRKGTHNDRNFDFNRAEHIDSEKTFDNLEWNYLNSTQMSFRNIELTFYEENFGDFLDKRNEKYEALYIKNRVLSMEQYYESRKSCPEDRIIQIGNIDGTIDSDTLWDIANDYRKAFDNKYSSHCKILTMALHVDETTPHVHIRRVWFAENEHEQKYVSQKEALKELGYINKYEKDSTSRFNNAKTEFTKDDRSMLVDICKEYCHGIEISNLSMNKHLSTREYKDKNFREKIDYMLEYQNKLVILTKELEERKKELEELENKQRMENQKLQDELVNMINFYYNSGLFNDSEERERLENMDCYKQVVEMHELFMERIKNIEYFQTSEGTEKSSSGFTKSLEVAER